MSFDFRQPGTLEEALHILEEQGDHSKVMAGGTALVLLLQERLIAPEAIVSLERIPELSGIRLVGDSLHIGAMTLLRDIERSPMVVEHAPLLARACCEVGNVRVRNQATLGGNLAEADYASDPPAALLALDALVQVASARGSRQIPVEAFWVGFYTTVLEPQELITEIVLPRPTAGTRMTYLKYKSRSSEDRPCTGVAAAASYEADRCLELRVAVGAACETPQRLAAYEQMARGAVLTDSLIDAIAEGYAADIETLDDMRGSSWYRSQMIRTHVRRALWEIRDGRR